MTLQLGPDLELPDDMATEAMAILGQRGTGKSNALVVLAEELYRVGVPWVAVDPKGDWWGIRSGADGTSPGLPIPVFGGRRDDLPLEAGAGRYLADLVYDHDLTCVLDVSGLSLGDRARLLAPFFDRLYDRHRAEPTVRHLLLEEAHVYIPQVVSNREAVLKEAAARAVLLGRTWGLGATMATQRSAKLHKDVLSQVGVLLAMRTSGPHDLDAIRGWITEHDVRSDLLASLPTLPPGTAWLWSPAVLGRMEQVSFRRRDTFDSGATPKVGQRARPPATLADVDLAAVKAAMADAIERAEAEDPRALRRRIDALEREVAEARKVRPALDPALVALLGEHATAVEMAAERGEGVMLELQTAVEMLRAAVATATRTLPAAAAPTAPVRRPARPARRAEPEPPAPAPQPPVEELLAQAGAAMDKGVWADLSRSERAFFSTLARHRGGLSKTQLALLAGYTIRSSTVKNALGHLRAAGLVTAAGTDPIALTPAGATLAATVELEALPTGEALYDYWTARLSHAERAVLAVMVEAWPETVTRQQLATATKYSSTSSTLKNALGRLRSLDLVDGWAANDTFMEAVAQ